MATTQLTATLSFADGSTQDVTSSADWVSSDEAVATVSAGLVTAVAEGTCTVTATSQGLSGNSEITVTNPPEGLTVTPSSATIEVG